MSVNRQLFNQQTSPMKNQMNSPLSTQDSVFNNMQQQNGNNNNNRPLNSSNGGINGVSSPTAVATTTSVPLPTSRWAGTQQSPVASQQPIVQHQQQQQQNFGQFGFPQANNNKLNGIYGQPQSPGGQQLRRSSEFSNNSNGGGGWNSNYNNNSNGKMNSMMGGTPVKSNPLNTSNGGVSKTKYSKDELLNLYDPLAKIPENLVSHTHILSEEVQAPINFNFENNLSKSRERTNRLGGGGGLGSNNIMNRGIRKDNSSHDRMSKPKWGNSPSSSQSWRTNKDDDKKVWYYLDPQNCTQGPFSSLEMDSWNKAGYFSATLMVKRGEGNFVELKKLLVAFPDSPFTSVGDLLLKAFEKDDNSSGHSTENDDDSIDHDSIEEELEKRFEKDLLKPTLFDDQKKKDMNTFGPLEPTSPSNSVTVGNNQNNNNNNNSNSNNSGFGIGGIADVNDQPIERTTSPQYAQQPLAQHQPPQQQQPPQQTQPQQVPQHQQQSLFDQQQAQQHQQQSPQQIWSQQQMWNQQQPTQALQQQEQAHKYMLYQQLTMLQQKIVMYQQYMSSLSQQYQQIQIQPQSSQTQIQLQQLQQLQEQHSQQCMMLQQKCMYIQYQIQQPFQPSFQQQQPPQPSFQQQGNQQQGQSTQQQPHQLFQHMLQQQQQAQLQQQQQAAQQQQAQQNYFLQQQAQAQLLQQQQAQAQALALAQAQQQQALTEPKREEQQQVEQLQQEEEQIEHQQQVEEQIDQIIEQQQTTSTTSTTTTSTTLYDDINEGVWGTSIKQQEHKTTTTAHLSVHSEEFKAPIDIEDEHEETSVQNAIEEINNTTTTTTTTTVEPSSVPIGNPWVAATESVAPVVNKKKSLAEIQAEEREQKKKEMEEAKIRHIENSKNQPSASNVMKWAGAGVPTWSVDTGMRSLSLKEIQDEERAREKREQAINIAVDNASEHERKKPVSLSDVMREQAKEKERKQQQEQLQQQQYQQEQQKQSTFNPSSPWSIDERKSSSSNNNSNNNSSYPPVSIGGSLQHEKSNRNNNNNNSNENTPQQPHVVYSNSNSNKILVRPSDDFWSEHSTSKPSLSVRSNAPVAPTQPAPTQNEYPTLNILPNRQATIVSKHTPVSTIAKNKSAANSSGVTPGQARPDFIKWCHQQLKSLTSNDVSVITELLCSLKTEIEIRECAKECLGYSSEVNNFISEYLLARSDEPGLTFESSSPVIAIPFKKQSKSQSTNSNVSKTKKKK